MSTVRVAAAQFAVGSDVEANLATCLRVIDEAVEQCRPALLVLPEFCNHLSWYDDKAHCWNVSVELDGPFVRALRDKAREHGLHLVANCTVRRGPDVATGTSILIGPDGAILSTGDKQVLMGHENDYLRRADEVCPIVETPVGKLGLYACMDGVINETPRALALRGAEVLCNSLNSFALDEASLHVPVRAPENRVFIVAANKVGPLIPQAMLPMVSQMTGIPIGHLHGAGESQIVAPDGTVLAKAPRNGEAVVWADIDPSVARDKRRSDGTDVFASRRPELYGAIGRRSELRAVTSSPAERVVVAALQLRSDGVDAIDEAADALRTLSPDVRMVVLPELFCFEGAVVSEPRSAQDRSQRAIDALRKVCPKNTLVVTSLVHEGRHEGVVIDASGVTHRQPQLHRCERHGGWSSLGSDVVAFDTSFGRLGVVVGDDAIYPETFRLLALAGVDVVAAPIHVIEAWEVDTGLRERSAENRVCLVAATRPGIGRSVVMTLHRDFTLLTEWKERVFDGNINDPIATWAEAPAGLVSAEIHPLAAHDKFVSRNTHVVDGRPWHLVDAITKGAVQ